MRAVLTSSVSQSVFVVAGSSSMSLMVALDTCDIDETVWWWARRGAASEVSVVASGGAAAASDVDMLGAVDRDVGAARATFPNRSDRAR